MDKKCKQYAANAIVFFAGNPRICELFVEKIKKLGLQKTTHFLFIKEVMNFYPPDAFSKDLQKMLLDIGVPEENIKILAGYGSATAKEMEAVQKHLKENPIYKKIYSAGIWWHMPRISLLWLKHGRMVKWFPIWSFEIQNLRFMIYEPIKYFLIILPANLQSFLGHWFFSKNK